MPGLAHNNRINAGVGNRQGFSGRQTGRGLRVQPRQEREHDRVGFDRHDVQAACQQRPRELAGARTDIRNLKSDLRHQPVDGGIRIARSPTFVLLGD